MPDYFFHVAIELCPQQELETNLAQPPGAIKFFEALRPFTTRSARPTRDHRFDRKQHQSRRSEKPSITSGPQLNVPSIAPSSPDDHRFDTVYINGTAMTSTEEDGAGTPAEGNIISTNIVNRGLGSTLSPSYLKGQFAESNYDEGTAASWGIVHLYRDADPTPSLTLHTTRPYQSSDLWSDSPRNATSKTPHSPPTDAECTTLCILAVPSYMTPADFLAFVGPGTRDAVSHFRMLRTARQNRYMVLMKFREGKIARKWQAEWNGKIWNAM